MGGESDVNDGYEHDLPVLGSADGLTGTVGAPSPREKGAGVGPAGVGRVADHHRARRGEWDAGGGR